MKDAVVLILACSSGVTTFSESLRLIAACCVSFYVRAWILSPLWSGGIVRGQLPSLLRLLLNITISKHDHPSIDSSSFKVAHGEILPLRT